MSMTAELFGPSDPTAPVVIFIQGNLECPDIRSNMINSVRRSMVLAEIDGKKAELDHALELLDTTLAAPLVDPSIVVVRGGQRPVVWELPGGCDSRPARLLVRDTPPAWLDLIATERSAA